MSDYKKKRQNLIRAPRSSPHSEHESYDSIRFSSQSSEAKGRKKKKRGRSATPIIVLVSVVLAAITAYAVTVTLHPVGVVEYFSGLYASVGSGSGYDINVSGSKPSYTVGAGSLYYTVSDNSVNCYNNGGKVVFERAHSYTDPVIKVSDTRYLLYAQGEKEISVNTLSKTLYTHNFESGIICAAISDSGGYAVATKSGGYDSSVAVFDKNNKKIYEWFSADETVNAIALSSNGKTLAVSTLKVENGKYVSGIYVLRFDSANPIMKRSYTDSVVYQLYAVSNSSVCAVFSDTVEFLNYKKDSVTTHQSEYSVNMVKQVGDRIIVLRTVAANRDDSLFEVYRSDGKKTSSFNVNKYITDFSYKSGKIYVLGLSELAKYDLKGNLLAAAGSSYDALFIEAISDNNVACIRNSVIEKCTLTKTGD